MLRLFCLSSEPICAVLAVLNRINSLALSMPGCSVLGVDKFLVGGFKVNQDTMFIKDVPATLWITFSRLLSIFQRFG